MLEQLKGLVKEYSADAIITNPAIPNERNDEAVELASTSIMGSLQNMISNGKMNDVQQLFDGSNSSTVDLPATQQIKGNFVEGLMQKFGLDHGKAAQIATTLIPLVLSQFGKKANSAGNTSFDLSSLMGSLAGGGNIGDMLGKATGNNNKTGDGLMDKVKGMFN